MLNALFLLDPPVLDLIYGPEQREQVGRHVNLIEPDQTPGAILKDPSALGEIDLIFSGWGMPPMDPRFLEAAPRLKAVFYGAGSVKGFCTDEAWQRGIRVTSAWQVNAQPVAEYALGHILLALKRAIPAARMLRETRGFDSAPIRPVAGGFDATVGLISLGAVGRALCRLLTRFDFKVLAHDPFVTPEQARELGAEWCGLEDIFRRADVVSLHTPWLKETENMIRGSHLASMKPGATFLNTSRGAVVAESEMIGVLRERPDLQAVLDVTHPEPPASDSPLFDLPNVFLTPHIAGSMDSECRRMGQAMIDDLDRYLAGEPMRYEVTRAKAGAMA